MSRAKILTRKSDFYMILALHKKSTTSHDFSLHLGSNGDTEHDKRTMTPKVISACPSVKRLFVETVTD